MLVSLSESRSSRGSGDFGWGLRRRQQRFRDALEAQKSALAETPPIAASFRQLRRANKTVADEAPFHVGEPPIERVNVD